MPVPFLHKAKQYAAQWVASLSDWREVAKRVSPLEYVCAGLPPILTIHGDSDSIVPFEHGVRLHRALDDAGVANQLHTIPGGDHGGFTLEENLEAMRTIRAFLRQHGVVGETAASNE